MEEAERPCSISRTKVKPALEAASLSYRSHLIGSPLLRWIGYGGAEDADGSDRAVRRVRLLEAHPLDRREALADAPKDSVLSIQPRCRRKRDKKLAAVCIWAAVGHGEDARSRVLQEGAHLILKGSPTTAQLALTRMCTQSRLPLVDGLSAAAGATGIAPLDHTIGNDAVEDAAVIVGPPGELEKVCTRPRSLVHVQLEGKGALHEGGGGRRRV